MGPEPPPDYPPGWEPKAIERNYNRALDEPGTVGKRDLRGMTKKQQKDLRDYIDSLKK